MAGAYLLLSWNRGLYTVFVVLVTSFFAVAGIEIGWSSADFRLSGSD